MALKLRARIEADGSGFARTMGGLERQIKSWASNVRSYLISAFSIGAIVRYTRELFEHVDNLKKISKEYNVSLQSAQQLHTLAGQTNREMKELAGSAEDLAAAFEEINRRGIQPLITKDQLDAIERAKAFYQEIKQGAIAEGAAVLGGPSSVEGFQGGGFWKKMQYLVSGAALRLGGWLSYPIVKYGTPEGMTDKALDVLLGGNRTGQSNVRMGIYGRTRQKPRAPGDLTDQQFDEWLMAMVTQMAELEDEIMGTSAPAAKKLREARAGTLTGGDQLARIGGFVGGANPTIKEIQRTNKLLDDMKRLLDSTGIKLRGEL